MTDISKKAISKRFIESVGVVMKATPGLRKSKIAASLGIGATNLSEILGSRMMVSTELAAKFCLLYRINLTWLLTGEGTAKQKEYSSGGGMDELHDSGASYTEHSLERVMEENKTLRNQLAVLQNIVQEQQALIDAFKSGAIIVADSKK